MCLALEGINTCTNNVEDDTLLIYQSMLHFDCNHHHMLFMHGIDGTLTHKCSGKKICPNRYGYLVASSKCELTNSKFIRTKVSYKRI